MISNKGMPIYRFSDGELLLICYLREDGSVFRTCDGSFRLSNWIWPLDGDDINVFTLQDGLFIRKVWSLQNWIIKFGYVLSHLNNKYGYNYLLSRHSFHVINIVNVVVMNELHGWPRSNCFELVIKNQKSYIYR